MSSVRRFEDLECHKLTVQLRELVMSLTGREVVRREFKFVDQMRDAARSPPRNIAEGFGRFNPTEILRFLSYAQGSLDEVKNHAVDGRESGYFSGDETEAMLSLIRRAHGAMNGWRRYLQSPAARRFYERHKAERRQRDWPNPPRSVQSEPENP